MAGNFITKDSYKEYKAISKTNRVLEMAPHLYFFPDNNYVYFRLQQSFTGLYE